MGASPHDAAAYRDGATAGPENTATCKLQGPCQNRAKTTYGSHYPEATASLKQLPVSQHQTRPHTLRESKQVIWQPELRWEVQAHTLVNT